MEVTGHLHAPAALRPLKQSLAPLCMIYFIAIGLTPGGSSTVRIYINSTQNSTMIQNTQNGIYITIRIPKLTKENKIMIKIHNTTIRIYNITISKRNL
jgi:hypothetical protein